METLDSKADRFGLTWPVRNRLSKPRDAGCTELVRLMLNLALRMPAPGGGLVAFTRIAEPVAPPSGWGKRLAVVQTGPASFVACLCLLMDPVWTFAREIELDAVGCLGPTHQLSVADTTVVSTDTSLT